MRLKKLGWVNTLRQGDTATWKRKIGEKHYYIKIHNDRVVDVALLD